MHSLDFAARMAARGMTTEIRSPGDPGWAQARDLIERHFAQVYGAALALPPVDLAVALTRSGRLAGAAGLRGAAQGFFSDIYLDRPAAAQISARDRHPVDAQQILEVVSMACPHRLATLPLIAAITAEGRLRGKSWGLFTATASLRRLLAHAGVPVLALAPANPARLTNAASWGSYYARDPWVCALRDHEMAVIPALCAMQAPNRAVSG